MCIEDACYGESARPWTGTRLRDGSGNVRPLSLSARPLSLLPPREPWVRLIIGTGVSTLRDCLIIVIRHLTIDLQVSIVSGAYPQLPETFGGESGATPGHSEQA